MTVLLADEINRLCVDENGKPVEKPLIAPFCPSRLREASYQLTLGYEIHLGGEQRRLEPSEEITLPPHQVAVVSTRETLLIPQNLVARWSLRVANIYEGLLWTGGPQVDPGWEGQLFCPIYNLAERPVVLKCGEGLFTMDFVRTTAVTEELEELWKDPKYPKVPFEPVRKTLEDHDIHRLRSAPYELIDRVEKAEKESADASERIASFDNRMVIYATLMFAVLGIVVAALSLMVASQTLEFLSSSLFAVPIVLSILAIAIALVSAFVSFRISVNIRKCQK